MPPRSRAARVESHSLVHSILEALLESRVVLLRLDRNETGSIQVRPQPFVAQAGKCSLVPTSLTRRHEPGFAVVAMVRDKSGNVPQILHLLLRKGVVQNPLCGEVSVQVL